MLNKDGFMKILVTGANGYLGRGIVKKLLDFGNEVIATDYKLDNIDDRAIKIPADLFNIENPYIFFSKPDVVLHLAWKDGFVHYSDSHILNLPKHYSFMMKMVSSDIKMMSFMGSMHEIGFYEGCVKDNTPCNPVTQYGISKNALREITEVMCKQREKKYQWLRGYYIVGNDPKGSSVFSKIAKAENEEKKEFPFTMGLNQYDFVDYDFFCEMVACTVQQDEILGIINICSGYPERLSDRVERFLKDNNYKIIMKYGSFPDREYDSKAIWGDASKIQEIMKKNKR